MGRSRALDDGMRGDSVSARTESIPNQAPHLECAHGVWRGGWVDRKGTAWETVPFQRDRGELGRAKGDSHGRVDGTGPRAQEVQAAVHYMRATQ
jgi:hypothetical protein